MHNKGDDYEPIIATRRSREGLREDTQPLWLVVLALCAGLAVVVLLAWWWLSRSPNDDASTVEQSENSAPAMEPEIHVEQPVAPPARDAETGAEIPQEPAPPAPAVEPETSSGTDPEQQTAIPEDVPEVVPDDEVEPTPPASVSVRFMSPDAQVRIELRRPSESSPFVTGKIGDVVEVPPGTYRMVASGPELERFEQDVIVDGGRSLEYTVELCAEREYTHETLSGQVVERRACASTEECESMFLILGEYADELVRDRAFRTQQCETWRAGAAPEGSWTLNINCDGATPATTCRIEIAEGACMFAEPRRSARGTACPRAELTDVAETAAAAHGPPSIEASGKEAGVAQVVGTHQLLAGDSASQLEDNR